MFKTLRSKLLFGTIISVVVINIIFTIFIAIFLENTLRNDIIKEITNIKSFSINTINQNEIIGESKWKSLNSIKELTNSYVSMINNKGEINEYVSVVISEDEINNIVSESKNLKSIIRFKRLNNIYCVTYNYPIYLDNDFYCNLIIQKDYSEKYNKNINVITIVIAGQVIVVLSIIIIISMIISKVTKPINESMKDLSKSINSKDIIINSNDEIGELAEAIISMRQELLRQERVKEEMIHNISHDLKTPIATIKSYGESIKDGVYPYDTLEKSVDVIIKNAERLEKKVYSLLYLNRVEYLVSQNTGEKETNMKEVVEEVLQALIMIRSDIQIDTDLKDAYFYGSYEPWRITIENIMDNALRYAKDYVKITVDEDEVSVYNNGSQISEERLASLFKPFEKGQGGQFGIGLSIVHKVTSANGYIVSGENVPDGVIFRIYREHKKEGRESRRKQRNENRKGVSSSL